jgi:hypothetical protein
LSAKSRRATEQPDVNLGLSVTGDRSEVPATPLSGGCVMAEFEKNQDGGNQTSQQGDKPAFDQFDKSEKGQQGQQGGMGREGMDQQGGMDRGNEMGKQGQEEFADAQGDQGSSQQYGQDKGQQSGGGQQGDWNGKAGQQEQGQDKGQGQQGDDQYRKDDGDSRSSDR